MLLASIADYDVVGEAANGADAVRVASEVRPDIVLMDVVMPEMNGFEAPRRIVAMLVGVKIIGLSGHNNAQYKELMRQAGAVAYITKDQLADDLGPFLRAVTWFRFRVSPDHAQYTEGVIFVDDVCQERHGEIARGAGG